MTGKRWTQEQLDEMIPVHMKEAYETHKKEGQCLFEQAMKPMTQPTKTECPECNAVMDEIRGNHNVLLICPKCDFDFVISDY